MRSNPDKPLVAGWCNRGRYPGRDVLFTSNSAFHAKSHHNTLAICYLIVYLYALNKDICMHRIGVSYLRLDIVTTIPVITSHDTSLWYHHTVSYRTVY